MRSIRGRNLFAGIAAVAALAALPASAMAGTKSKTATLSPGSPPVTLTPKCTGNQRATGGGFAASPPTPEATFIFESRKVGQKTWQISAKQEAFGPTLTLTAYAYCSSKGPKTKEFVSTVTSPLGTFGSANATCGSGKAQAGGFAYPAPTGSIFFLISSFRLDSKTWQTGGKSTGSPLPNTSYVYCAKKPKVKTKLGVASSGTNDAVVTATSSKCKKHTKVLSGGFSQPASGSTGNYMAPITTSAKSGKTWLTTGVNAVPVPGPVNTLTTYAYCG